MSDEDSIDTLEDSSTSSYDSDGGTIMRRVEQNDPLLTEMIITKRN